MTCLLDALPGWSGCSLMKVVRICGPGHVTPKRVQAEHEGRFSSAKGRCEWQQRRLE